MSFKKLMKAGFPKEALQFELELPGDPQVYSYKWIPCNRRRIKKDGELRHKAWLQFLRSFFPPQLQSYKPVVLIVKFYVAPPDKLKITEKELASDKVPATQTHEVCEFLLSFMESIHKVLINSYRQIVKIDASKFFSNNPRTCFKFLRYDDWLALQGNYTPKTTPQRERTHWKKGTLQS